MLRRIDLTEVHADLAAALPRPELIGDEPVAVVRSILADVRAEGDAALRRLTQQFDGVALDSVVVSEHEVAAALNRVDPTVVAALRAAAERITAFHELQLPPAHDFQRDGVAIRSFAKPVRRAGCYVPGGRAAYPSTVLMTVVPAVVAGVAEVVVCVPPDRETGRVADVTLAAASIAGATSVVSVGGAQGIAALAFGTESVPPVDVICGPGNRFVAIAKQEVSGTVGVAAAFAGPSEIVVVADGSAPPDLVAVDLMVQAEHGPDGLAWLVAWDDAVIDAVDAALVKLVADAPRADDVRATLAAAGIAARCRDAEQAMAVVNLVAPEHLELMTEDPERLVDLVENAGAIFCGPWSPASLGDYVAGPSHVLPTNGSARFSSALTVADFLKHHHVVTVDRAGIETLGPLVETLATAEGLAEHARSVRLRLEQPR